MENIKIWGSQIFVIYKIMFLKISKLVSRNTEYFENISKKNQIHQHFLFYFRWILGKNFSRNIITKPVQLLHNVPGNDAVTSSYVMHKIVYHTMFVFTFNVFNNKISSFLFEKNKIIKGKMSKWQMNQQYYQ